MEIIFTKTFNEKEVVRKNLPSLVDYFQESIGNSIYAIECETGIEDLENCDNYNDIEKEITIQTLNALQDFITEYKDKVPELVNMINRRDY